MKSSARARRRPGARPLVAMLPSGRSIWLTVRPTLIPVAELNRFAESLHRADARHARALASSADSARQLAREVKRNVTSIGRSRSRQYWKLRSRILRGDGKLDRRIDVLSTRVAHQAQADRKKEDTLLRSHRRRDLQNQLVVVSAIVLMAAYGQRNDPLAENNLVIAIALVLWLVGDEISDLFSGKRSIHNGPIRGADIWSYTAPFANLLTGWWLLSDQQHHRFITGTTQGNVVLPGKKGIFEATMVPLKLPGSRASGGKRHANERRETYEARVDISSRIAPEHLPDFRNLKDISAVASIQSFKVKRRRERPKIGRLSSEVIDGSWLLLKVDVSATRPGTLTKRDDLPPILKQLSVNWAVDTRGTSA